MMKSCAALLSIMVGIASFGAVITIKSDADNSKAEWVRPGDWSAVAEVLSEPVSISSVSFSTNTANAQVYSNLTEVTMYSLSAKLSTVMLDEFSTESLPGNIVYTTDAEGTSISGEVFTATSPGVYRVTAKVADDNLRYIDIPLVSRQGVWSNATVYIDDASIAGNYRKDVNDLFLSNLSDSTTSGTVVVGDSTNGLWWTVRCPCRPISGFTVQGYRSRNALSPHLLIGARHYGYNGNWSYLDFYDPVGNTNVSVSSGGLATGTTAYDMNVPIPQGWGFPLCAWALTNGWTRAEIAAMNIEDVAIYPIATGGPLPDSCCPYLMSSLSLETHFGEGSPVGGWAFSQTYVGRTGPDGVAAGNYMTPCTLRLPIGAGSPTWTCAHYEWSKLVRHDILTVYHEKKAIADFPPIYGGDSSGGIYMRDANGKWIMVSMFTTISSGPNLSAAVPVLRKLCEQYGDVLKEVE